MSQTETYTRYFYKCNVCDGNDHGAAYYDYEIVDCPACGTTDMTRWEALPNLSRDWSFCNKFGHDWRLVPGSTAVESCARCKDQRDLTPASGRIR